MTYALTEPATDPRDEGDRAADMADLARTVAIRAHLTRIEVMEDQAIDYEGRVICLWCSEPLDAERLAAQPHALRHAECQTDHEQFQRRHR